MLRSPVSLQISFHQEMKASNGLSDVQLVFQVLYVAVNGLTACVAEFVNRSIQVLCVFNLTFYIKT